MDLIVAKFGGTSVGNGSRIKKAAQSVVNEFMKGNQIVAVVSAVNKTTDELIELSNDAIGAGLRRPRRRSRRPHRRRSRRPHHRQSSWRRQRGRLCSHYGHGRPNQRMR